jgi:carboxypeptidase Taq
MVGSFPTYTIGNIMSSQFFASASSVPTVEKGLDKGDYEPLKKWLNDNVHQYGRSLTPTELLEKATGSGLSVVSYIADLKRKVADLA